MQQKSAANTTFWRTISITTGYPRSTLVNVMAMITP